MNFDVNYDPNFRMIYEINAKSLQLETAIQQTEIQLKNVNKKLDSLWYDLKLFTGLFIGVWLLKIFLGFLSSHFIYVDVEGTIVYVLIQFFCSVYRIAASWILIPLTLALSAQSLSLIIENRESNAEFTPPPLEGELREGVPEREKSYRSEQKKLIYVLTRYYASQDKLKQLRAQLESNPESLTLAELKYQLNQIPFYEQVRSANPDLRNKKENEKMKWI